MKRQIENDKTLEAVMGKDGLIEIISLSALDEIVGGLVDPEEALCRVTHEAAIDNTKENQGQAG